MGEYSRRDRPFLDSVHAELLALHAEGAIRPLVGREVPLEQAPAAIRDLTDRRTVGKVVVRVG